MDYDLRLCDQGEGLETVPGDWGHGAGLHCQGSAQMVQPGEGVGVAELTRARCFQRGEARGALGWGGHTPSGLMGWGLWAGGVAALTLPPRPAGGEKQEWLCL